MYFAYITWAVHSFVHDLILVTLFYVEKEQLH